MSLVGAVDFAAGNLVVPLSLGFSLDLENKFTFTPPNPEKLNLAVNPKTGLITAASLLQHPQERPAVWRCVLRKQNAAADTSLAIPQAAISPRHVRRPQHLRYMTPPMSHRHPRQQRHWNHLHPARQSVWSRGQLPRLRRNHSHLPGRLIVTLISPRGLRSSSTTTSAAARMISTS
jgi:hypothetical protein